VTWDIVYHLDADGNVPAVDFLVGCPTKTRANLLAVLNAVAAAPPPAFSGGGKWEAMHGKMRRLLRGQGRRSRPRALPPLLHPRQGRRGKEGSASGCDRRHRRRQEAERDAFWRFGVCAGPKVGRRLQVAAPASDRVLTATS